MTVDQLIKELYAMPEGDRDNLLAMTEWPLRKIEALAKQAPDKQSKHFMELTLAVYKLRKALMI